jgi:uncharacterized membrane protein YkvA (DUF1232 family)
MIDDRVPARTKVALGGLAVYLVSPWDIIPDFVPLAGQVDDAILLLLLVDGVLNQVDDAVLLEHWTGEVKTLRRLQELSRTLSDWTPQALKTFLFGKVLQAGADHVDAAPGERRAGQDERL